MILYLLSLSLQSKAELGDVHTICHHGLQRLGVVNLVDSMLHFTVHQIVFRVANSQVL